MDYMSANEIKKKLRAISNDIMDGAFNSKLADGEAKVKKIRADKSTSLTDVLALYSDEVQSYITLAIDFMSRPDKIRRLNEIADPAIIGVISEFFKATLEYVKEKSYCEPWAFPKTTHRFFYSIFFAPLFERTSYGDED